MLEVWVNGNTHHELARTIQREGGIFADCADLIAAGIRVPDDRQDCPLSGIAGLSAKVEPLDQKLVITASSDNLLPQIVSLEPPVDRAAEHQTVTSAYGFVLNYDASLEAGDLAHPEHSGSAGLALNLAAFAPWGAFRSDGFAETNAAGSRVVRLDSTFTMEDPDSLRTISVGDAISGDLQWARPVRFAGVQISKDFLLQPDLVTQPMPQFFGESAVPSTLDVFVNGVKLFEGQIEQGPFQIRDLPALTGSSEMTVVTTDVLGRQTLQTLSFFTSQGLLAQGLTAYTADAGVLRRQYGLEDFSYGDFVATGTLRHGITDWLTLEGHGETGGGIEDAGLGAVIGLPRYAAVSLALAGSHSSSGSGLLADAGYTANVSILTLFGEVSATQGDYRDIATLDGPTAPKLRMQLGGNIALGDYGTVSGSWIVLHAQPQRTQLATATYSLSFGGGYEFNLVGFRDLDARSSGAELFLSIPIGERTRAEASTRLADGRPQNELTVSQPADPDGGFGYRASVLSGATDGAEASAIWNGQALSANAWLTSADGSTAARLGASGSLVEIGGDLYAARRIDGAIALIDAGQSDVRIYHENRQVATTGADGTALVTGLVPYGRNNVGVGAEDYPMDVLMSAPDRVVIPNRFATIVNFAPARGRPALVALQLPDGKIPALGTPVELADRKDMLVVGARGRIFIENLPAPVGGRILLPAGPCGFLAVPGEPLGDDSIPEIGPVTCTMETNTESAPSHS
jgi:outer membrane usher protein